MAGRKIIEKHAGAIVSVLKSGAQFTREDLLFLSKFFKELADIVDKKLENGKQEAA